MKKNPFVKTVFIFILILLLFPSCEKEPGEADLGDLILNIVLSVDENAAKHNALLQEYYAPSRQTLCLRRGLTEISASPIDLSSLASVNGFMGGIASPDGTHFVSIGPYFNDNAGVVSHLIDQETGALTDSASFSPTAYKGYLCYSPDTAYLYGTSRNSYSSSPLNGYAVFRISGATGALSLAVQETVGTGSTDLEEIAVTPDGNFLYISDIGENSVYGFSRDAEDGSLAALSPESVSLGDIEPGRILIHPDSTFLYTNTDEGIKIFSINETTGALTSVSYTPELDPGYLYQWNIHPDGEYMIASSYTAIYVYDLDPVTG